MTDKTGKTRNETKTVMTELVLPNDANILGNLLGGRLLHWIDIAGALAATRHSEGLVATVTMDMVEFKHPVRVGNIVTLTSYVTWTGKTSIEVAVEVCAEDPLLQTSQFINKVYLVYVALDENANKRRTISYIPTTDEEITEFNGGFERKSKRIAESNAAADINCK